VIATFPDVRSGNVYQRLLYEHLKQRGIELAPGARFELRWLLPARRRVGVLHFHWPEARYTFGRGPAMLRPALSWVKLGLFALRLWVARALGYRLVPDERVSELFATTDAVVQSRGDGGTSGSLILALSLGMPVVVADRPAYTALTGGEEAGWLFEPDDEPSLRTALERAAADRAAAQEKGAAARARASRLDWGPIAERTAALLRGDLGEEVA